MASTELVAGSLYTLEHDLISLLDTEDLVSEEDRAQFEQELTVALQKAPDKRERFGQFILEVKARIKAAKEEKARLDARVKSLESGLERAENYAEKVIVSLGKDAKGKYPKLHGHTLDLSLRANAPSVDILDESLIPSEFKRLTITLPLSAWEEHLARYNDLRSMFNVDAVANVPEAYILGTIMKKEIETMRTLVKEAIQAGRDVPGADLKINEYSLQVK